MDSWFSTQSTKRLQAFLSRYFHLRDFSTIIGISLHSISMASFPRIVLPLAGRPICIRASTQSFVMTKAVLSKTSCLPASIKMSPLLPVPFLGVAVSLIASRTARATKSSSAICRMEFVHNFSGICEISC